MLRRCSLRSGFEPKLLRRDDIVEVTKGLMAGERIVISGTYLVDSESRMKGGVRP
jgi:hypothetical protein